MNSNELVIMSAQSVRLGQHACLYIACGRQKNIEGNGDLRERGKDRSTSCHENKAAIVRTLILFSDSLYQLHYRAQTLKAPCKI